MRNVEDPTHPVRDDENENHTVVRANGLIGGASYFFSPSWAHYAEAMDTFRRQRIADLADADAEHLDLYRALRAAGGVP